MLAQGTVGAYLVSRAINTGSSYVLYVDDIEWCPVRIAYLFPEAIEINSGIMRYRASCVCIATALFPYDLEAL